MSKRTSKRRSSYRLDAADIVLLLMSPVIPLTLAHMIITYLN